MDAHATCNMQVARTNRSSNKGGCVSETDGTVPGRGLHAAARQQHVRHAPIGEVNFTAIIRIPMNICSYCC